MEGSTGLNVDGETMGRVAAGLCEGDLGDETMAPDPVGQGQATGHKHGRPVDSMEAQYVLPNDMVCRPAMVLQLVGTRLSPLWQQTWQESKTSLKKWYSSSRFRVEIEGRRYAVHPV